MLSRPISIRMRFQFMEQVSKEGSSDKARALPGNYETGRRVDLTHGLDSGRRALGTRFRCRFTWQKTGANRMKRARCKSLCGQLGVGTRRRRSVSTAGEDQFARPIPASRGTVVVSGHWVPRRGQADGWRRRTNAIGCWAAHSRSAASRLSSPEGAKCPCRIVVQLQQVPKIGNWCLGRLEEMLRLASHMLTN